MSIEGLIKNYESVHEDMSSKIQALKEKVLEQKRTIAQLNSDLEQRSIPLKTLDERVDELSKLVAAQTSLLIEIAELLRKGLR